MDYLTELMKNKASFESFRRQEREIIQLGADYERLSNRFGLIEMDHKHYQTALEGLTREDVEGMLNYKEDKIESDRKIQELYTLIKSLNIRVSQNIAQIQQFDVDQRNKDDFFRKIEKSIHELDESSQMQKQEQHKLDDIDSKINELKQRLNMNEYRMADFSKRITDVHQNLQDQLASSHESQLAHLSQQLQQTLSEQQEQMRNLQGQIEGDMLRLAGQVTSSVEAMNNQAMTEFSQRLDSLQKRMLRAETLCGEIQHDNDQLKMHKAKQMDELIEQFRQLQNYVNTKLISRISTVEKDLVNGFSEVVGRVAKLEQEVEIIQGPLLNEFKLLKNECFGLFRELERNQTNYRELIGDYLKTLDAKLVEGVNRPGDLINTLETKDGLVRASTQLKVLKSTLLSQKQANQREGQSVLSKGEQEMMSSKNVLASLVNQQLVNNNSLLSLGSDISNYLKKTKHLQENQVKKALRNIDQHKSLLYSPLSQENDLSNRIDKFLLDHPNQIQLNNVPSSSLQLRLYSSPLSQKSKSSKITELGITKAALPQAQMIHLRQMSQPLNQEKAEEKFQETKFLDKSKENVNSYDPRDKHQEVDEEGSSLNKNIQSNQGQSLKDQARLNIRTKSVVSRYQNKNNGNDDFNNQTVITSTFSNRGLNSQNRAQTANQKTRKRNNYSSNIQSDLPDYTRLEEVEYQKIIENQVQTLKNSNDNHSHKHENVASTLAATSIGNDYSTLLQNVASIKKKDQKRFIQGKNLSSLSNSNLESSLLSSNIQSNDPNNQRQRKNQIINSHQLRLKKQRYKGSRTTHNQSINQHPEEITNRLEKNQMNSSIVVNEKNSSLINENSLKVKANLNQNKLQKLIRNQQDAAFQYQNSDLTPSDSFNQAENMKDQVHGYTVDKSTFYIEPQKNQMNILAAHSIPTFNQQKFQPDVAFEITKQRSSNQGEGDQLLELDKEKLKDKRFKSNIMLEKQMPLTLHRFQHLMKDIKD